ncbi:MAG: ComEA family DNA-binding protein [Desulfuromonadaceae bacterium]
MIVCAALLFVPLLLKTRTNQEIPVRTGFAVLPSDRIYVKVSGDVLHAGVYDVPAKSMADIVINLAGQKRPMKKYASTASAVRPLLNGSAVNLSGQPDGSLLLTVNQMTVPEKMILGIPLDIGMMSEADLNLLPGIGPVLAGRIVTLRHKNGGILTVKDLVGIDGIGEKKYKRLHSFF